MKQHKVTIEPSGTSFLVKPDETILDAALRQQIEIPYNCQEGDCATCMGRLLEGQIDYPEIEPYVLTPTEIKAGNILTCCSAPNSDCIIWLEGVSAPESTSQAVLNCPLITCTPLNETITEIVISTANYPNFYWQAGQYVNLHSTTPEDSRPYTIANYGQEKCIFYLQHVVTYNRLLIEQIKLQAKVTLSGPFGDCIYHSQPNDIPLYLVAGGTGFAQLRAIAEAAFLDQYAGPIHAFWGVRKAQDFHSLDLLAQWKTQYANFDYTLAISDDTANWQGKTGVIHQVALEQFLDLAGCRCYISGPSEMVKQAKLAFQLHGQDPKLCHSD